MTGIPEMTRGSRGDSGEPWNDGTALGAVRPSRIVSASASPQCQRIREQVSQVFLAHGAGGQAYYALLRDGAGG